MKKNIKGFTIIELVVVIVIIAILSTISIVGFNVIQQGARNTQRSSEVSAVAEALEKYYMKNGEYPSCAMMTQSTSATTVANALFPGLDPNNLTAPGDQTAGHNSFVCSAPTTAQYGYLGGSNSCTIEYQEEGSSNPPKTLDCRHHAISPNYTLALSTSTDGTVSGGGSFASGTSTPITATPSQYYQGLSNNTAVWDGSIGCNSGGNGLSHNITVDSGKNCTAHFEPIPLSAPSAPVVTPSTASGTTTFSWGAATCGTGNTANYRYDYTIPESGYDSGWVTTASTSAVFSTWDDGHHYNLAVQANCYNPVTNGPWSTSGTASYYVATPFCTLTANAGANGTASGGGSYDCGTSPATPVITASPNTYYYFNGWSGSGCTAGGSNPATITVTGNITCTASFPITDITPAAPTVSYSSTNAIYTYFTFSTTCPGPNATPDYQYASYNGGTLLEGYYENGTTTNDNPRPITTMITSGTTYTFSVRVYCSNPVTSSNWVYGSTNYYKDYWWYGAGSQLIGKSIYYADSGVFQYKVNLNANISPQSSTSTSEPTYDPSHPNYSELVSPQIYPAVNFVNYPGQVACKALGGRLPNNGEVANMIDYNNTYGSLGFPHLGYPNYMSAGETNYDTTRYAIRDIATNSFGDAPKTTVHTVRCVRDY
jgi:prepilin-type N-terminal cleavage/methylation domain-containing protein